MFGNWLKSESGATDALDLQRHVPEEFEGKTLTLRGREYVLGARILTSDQGYAHRLINRQSGLCLHVVQVRPEYRRDPEGAWTASKTKQDVTMRLRDRLRMDESGEAPGVLTAHLGHGGSFELHEVPWGMFADETTSCADQAVKSASTLSDSGDLAAAATMLRELLSRHPYHTVALNNLAAIHDAQGQSVAALELVSRAVEAEPNWSFYRGSQVALAVDCPRRRQASIFFDEFERHFAHVHDYDLYGIHACLRSGMPERAREILQRGTLPDQQAEALRATVEAAVGARQRFADLHHRLVLSHLADLHEEATHRQLESMHAAFDVDPLIQANLGLRLQAVAQYRRGAQLLLGAAGGIEDKLVPYCHANAGYCLLAASDWKAAMVTLRITMDELTAIHTTVEPADVPGLVQWIGDDGMVVESQHPSAADLLDRTLHDCPDKALITPQVVELSALLRKASGQLRGSLAG